MNSFFRFVYRICGFVIRIFHPLEVVGLENLPPHGALLCPNHSSNWDPIFVVLSVPIDYHLYTMAKSQLFCNRVVAWFLTQIGAFPVKRGNTDIKAVKTAISAIKSGDNLMIFPEGTRVKSKGDVQSKGGVAMIAVRTGAIMVPIYVEPPGRWFHRTKLIIGEGWKPQVTGRRGTAEELQSAADRILKEAYDLGRNASCRK